MFLPPLLLGLAKEYVMPVVLTALLGASVTAALQKLEVDRLKLQVSSKDVELATSRGEVTTLRLKIADQSLAIRDQNDSILAMSKSMDGLTKKVAAAEQSAAAVTHQNSLLLQRIAKAEVPNDWEGATTWSQEQFKTILSDWKK